MKRFTIYPVVVLLCAFALYSHAFAQCGVERWSVKTGTDSGADQINLSAPKSNTIAALRALSAPNPIPANSRVSPTETTVWVLNATLTKYKLESDSDYHLVLADSAGNTMIAEIPAPTCVGAGSPFASGISHARSQFNAKFTATTSFKTTSTPVRITGVGFFDFLHGQTGVAPNGIELHPVIDIIFNPTTSSDFTIAASGNVSLPQGSSQTVGVSTSASGSFNSAIALSISGLPSGASGTFSPTSIAAPGTGSSNLTITAGATTPTGTYNLTITGTGGGITHTTTVILTVSSSGGGTVSQQLIGNPGFENGSSNPAPWTATSGVITNSSSEAAHGGSWKAWLDGYGATHTDTLSQSVTIPAGATSATLSFWIHIDTDETTTSSAYDTLSLQIRNSSGTVLATLATYSNLNAGTGFKQVSFNLLTYKGQSIQINLAGAEDYTLQTSFVVDDFSLNVTAPSSAVATIAALDLTTAPMTAPGIESPEVPATTADGATSAKEEIFFDDDGGRVFLVRRGDVPIDQSSNHGGEVIANPELHNIILGSWKDADKTSVMQIPPANDVQVRNLLGRVGVNDLSLPSTWQDQPMEFGEENKITDMQIRASLDAMFKQSGISPKGSDIFVIYLPPGTLSTIGELYGGKHYLGYHDHYNSENGLVNYVVIPFDSNIQRQQDTIHRATVEAIINPVGNGWY
ncbi:MAG: hypothetical protein J2P41_01870 [Blastocatellia bacterium]|nr:hypothetical protein [Blastocatellia bacterium]